MNILSLFDGISCGQIALNKLGIKYDNYFASEIDKHAIQVTQDNFPNTIQVGDVIKLNGTDLPKIDLIIGGSPCQGFSFAGKQLNFEDSRSKLFFQYVRLIEECNPKYFLLENVRMKKSSEEIITKYMGVEPIEINSKLVSAQNRRRLYWTNIPCVEQPIDKNILIDDIIIGNKKELSIEDKIKSILSTYNGDYEIKDNFIIIDSKNGKKSHIDLTKDAPYSFYETRTEEGKAERRRIRQETGRDSTPRSKKYKKYIPLPEQKANCLVTIESPLDYIIDYDWNYRRYNQTEYERLQTLPDGYTKSVNHNHAKKMIGNGWTVEVIVHILKNIYFSTLSSEPQKVKI